MGRTNKNVSPTLILPHRGEGVNRLLRICIFLISAIWAATTYAQEPESIGIVTAVRGQVSVTSGGVRGTVEVGSPVFLGDTFETGAGSGVKMLFDDDSLISLGSNTTFEVTEFVYTPTTRKSLSNVFRGKVKSVIQKLEGRESNVEFATPNAVAGVKGTTIFIDADRGIIFVLEGEAFVRGTIPGAREVRLVGGEFTRIVDGNPTDPEPITDELKKELEEGTDIEEALLPRDSLYEQEYPGGELISIPPPTITGESNIGDLPTVPPVDLLPGVDPDGKAPVGIIIPPPGGGPQP